tara:strand:- start:1077 stop:1442 length:366 start_codon:yes stop_codon:yes gene_type:complete
LICLPVYKCETAGCGTEVTKATNGVYLCFPCWKNERENKRQNELTAAEEVRRKEFEALPESEKKLIAEWNRGRKRKLEFNKPSLAMQERFQKQGYTRPKFFGIKSKEKITHNKKSKKMEKE